MFNNRQFRLRNSSYCAFVLLCLSVVHASTATAQTQTSAAAATETRWYDVELLIFKYSNPEEFGSENWPQRWSLPDTKNSVDLENMGDKYKADFDALAPSAQSFGGMLERLEKSTRYEVLNHTAWRQRGLDKDQAVGVRIHAGHRYLPQAPVPAATDFGLFERSFIEQDFIPEVTIRTYSETQAKSGPVLHELSGEVKIVLSRFLHVYTDLLLLKPVTLTPVDPATAQAAVNTAPVGSEISRSAYSVAWAQAPTPLSGSGNENKTLYGFNIKAHRRMRSGELHHIDHPLLGILIQVKPVETAKP